MHRPHPTADARLAILTDEEKARAEGSSAQDLADEMEALRYANDLALNEVGERDRRLKALGVFLDRKLRAERSRSILVTRADGAEMLWTAQADGTGFHRERMHRPRMLDRAPGKPDAGAG